MGLHGIPNDPQRDPRHKHHNGQRARQQDAYADDHEEWSGQADYTEDQDDDIDDMDAADMAADYDDYDYADYINDANRHGTKKTSGTWRPCKSASSSPAA